jgi:hypothetical protein
MRPKPTLEKMHTIWLISAIENMRTLANGHSLTDFSTEKNEPFLDKLGQLDWFWHGIKWFWMRPKPTLEEMHTIWLVFAMKKMALDASKTIPIDKPGQFDRS